MSESKPVTAPGVDIEAIRARVKGLVIEQMDDPENDRAALLAEIERLQSQPSGWRDISEAPRDGSEIVGRRNYDDGRADMWFIHWSTHPLGGWFDARGFEVGPTLFAPLPPPPQEQP